MSTDSQFISIFNDVLGPVMRGPSSSHTAGAYRIAAICRELAGPGIRRVLCVFDRGGSYAPTYKALGVDLAFAAGLLGRDMTDAAYDTGLADLDAAGIDLSFEIGSVPTADHPNCIRVVLDTADSRHTVEAKSTGGGVFEVYRYNDFEVRIDGKAPVFIALLPAGNLDSFLSDDGVFEKAVFLQGDFALVQVEAQDNPDSFAGLKSSCEKYGARYVRYLRPLFFSRRGDAPFVSGADLLEAASADGRSLGALGLQYEQSVLGLSREAAIEEAAGRFRIMKESADSGLKDQHINMDILEPSAADLMEGLEQGMLPVGGVTGKASMLAMAVMHVCNSRGVVCAAPTGGSAGVIPGVIIALTEHLKSSRTQTALALFAAGIVGMVVARRATFAAEIAGCQVEIGVAGAMAAAAVVELYGGSAAQALDAAAISLQNTMGSVCDPVKGGCEVPCHTRNAVSASSAFTCAAIAMGGYRNPIPFDETVDASYEVGKALPPELRCTALGGIAVTPSARKL